MKFASILLAASAIFTCLAAPQGTTKSRRFRLKSVGSAFEPINGNYLKNLNSVGVFATSASAQEVQAHFPESGEKSLVVNGLDGTPDIAFLVPTEPGSLVWRLVFGDVAISESRFSDWNILDGKLTYGQSPDRFWAFPRDGGWEVRWLDKGAITTADGFPFDLLVEYL